MRLLNLSLLFFFLFSINSYSLTECKGDDVSTWDNCIGAIIFSDGAKYMGGWKDGLPNGKATFTYADGTGYVGEYKDGERNGKGTETWPNGTKYVGGVKNHLECAKPRNGEGKHTKWCNG